MGVELMKDQNGKNHMVFSKDVSKEDLIMGDKIDDYEILQVLGEGSFGYVAKAKSRINHKIYAIKKLNFSSAQKKKEIQLVENEVAILKNLNHPLITKYFKSFKEGDCLYIVMEFMDNGDLSKLIKGHQTLDKPIAEERLWNIFIQALKSLEFVHTRNLIHRDIKPENLFISLDGTIKLGDFGVAANYHKKNNNNQANIKNLQNNQQLQDLGKIDCKGTVVGTAPFMSPEMIENTDYDLTSDVYSMGCAFFESMYWTVPRKPALDIMGIVEGKNILKLQDVAIKNNKDVYSKELVNLVKKMIELKKEIRPDSSTILKLFIAEYNKKYSKSSSIGSILSCLYSYPDLIQYFKNPNNEQNISSNQNSISYLFLYGLNSILNGNLNIVNGEDWRTSLFKIRSILSNHNTIYNEDSEINPRFFLSFLLGRIHKELNIKRGSYQNPFTSLFSGEIDSQPQNNMSNINYSKKEESFNYFLNNFMENNNSIISNYFYGNMKTKTVCSACQLTTYSYSAFNFITFNLDLIQKYLIKTNFQNMLNQINLFHCFMIQNDILIQKNNFSLYCRQCKQNSEHSERKQFSTFPRYFIICLDRGVECQNKLKIFYNEILDLTGKHDNLNSYNNFMLKGIIKRLDMDNKEHYISIYYDFNQKSWIERDDSSIQKITSPFDHKKGIEIMFFYEALLNNNGNNSMQFNMQQNISQNNSMVNSNMSMNITEVNNGICNININRRNSNIQTNMNMTGYANNNNMMNISGNNMNNNNMNNNNMNISGNNMNNNNMNMSGNNMNNNMNNNMINMSGNNMNNNNMNMSGNNMNNNMNNNNMNMSGNNMNNNNMNMRGNNMNNNMNNNMINMSGNNMNNNMYSGMGNGMFNNNMNMNMNQ